MAQVNVVLPQDLSDWAQARATQGGYADPADYVRDVVRREREHEDKLARLQTAIEEGLASPEVDATIEDIIAEGLTRHASR
jgi:antitoxin ParD1/3/4